MLYFVSIFGNWCQMMKTVDVFRLLMLMAHFQDLQLQYQDNVTQGWLQVCTLYKTKMGEVFIYLKKKKKKLIFASDKKDLPVRGTGILFS